ncbi:7TM-DISM domain-containing protein [Saccharospirillum mangrovi]|uniref:hybrid sensor histidine kinase/response regulator n=1 Tax=Saccharospirillum mangrovi TaxID=2161747 RepID=UPI000D38070D|nr:7TM-DISM domain-containing protein [Saccharospirillum mangrovi]
MRHHAPTARRLLAVLWLLLMTGAALADPVLLNQERYRLNILMDADYLDDPGNTLQLADLLDDEMANRFTPVHQNILRNGIFDGSHWLRLSLTNPDGQPQSVNFLVESHANHTIELYYPDVDGHYQSVRSGAAVALADRPEPLGTYVLPMSLLAGTHTLYLRLASQDPLNTQLWLMDRATLQASLGINLGLHTALLALQLLGLGFVLVALVRYPHPALGWATVFGVGLTLLCAGWNGLASALLPHWAFVDIGARNTGGILGLLGLTGLVVQSRQEHFSRWLKETLRWVLRGLFLMTAIALMPMTRGLGGVLLLMAPPALIALSLGWLYRRQTNLRYEYWTLAGMVFSVLVFLLIVGSSAGLLLSVSTNALLLHLAAVTASWIILRAAYHRARYRDANLVANSLNLPVLHWPLMRKLNHEMRGPINGVLGMAELLQDTSLSAHQQEYVNTMQAAGFSLLRQADQLQNLVRIGLNRLPESKDEFDLYDLLEDAVQPYSRLAHAKQLELVMDVAPELPSRYRGNAQIITQILSNLLDNALAYTENGEVLVQVKPWTGHRIRFIVTDTGPGLPKERKDSLFDFPTSFEDSVLSPREVYLGLPITRVLVGLLNGQLSYSSELRIGSTFWVDLPIPEVTDSDEANAQTSGDLADIRLMVVDDNLTCRKVIEHLGKSWGMDVLTVSNGQSALANLHNEYHKGTPIDVLVLDQNMPSMTGTELAERLRSDEALNRDILIIMLTGVDVGQVELDESRLNIQYLLTKPVSGRALKQTLMQALPDILHNRENHHAKKSLFF